MVMLLSADSDLNSIYKTNPFHSPQRKCIVQRQNKIYSHSPTNHPFHFLIQLNWIKRYEEQLTDTTKQIQS